MTFAGKFVVRTHAAMSTGRRTSACLPARAVNGGQTCRRITCVSGGISPISYRDKRAALNLIERTLPRSTAPETIPNPASSPTPFGSGYAGLGLTDLRHRCRPAANFRLSLGTHSSTVPNRRILIGSGTEPIFVPTKP